MLPNLKRLRMESGVSQQKLADAIEVSQPSINKYENHSIEPDIEILKRMANYFNTSVDYIIGHTDIRRKIERTDAFDLNREEAELMHAFRALDADERACVRLTIQTFLKKK